MNFFAYSALRPPTRYAAINVVSASIATQVPISPKPGLPLNPSETFFSFANRSSKSHRTGYASKTACAHAHPNIAHRPCRDPPRVSGPLSCRRPVMRHVARTLLPSTSAAMTWTRLACVNLFMASSVVTEVLCVIAQAIPTAKLLVY